MSGSKDPVGGPVELVTKLYNRYRALEIRDLEFKLYPDARHELLLEENKDEVINDVLIWLKVESKNTEEFPLFLQCFTNNNSHCIKSKILRDNKI